MRKGAFITILAAVVAGVAAADSPSDPGTTAAPIYGVKPPSGYRDWALISIASVGGNVNDLRAKLGNSVAVKAYRQGTRPFPDGTIIARLAYQQVTSEDNNKVFRAAAEKLGVPAEQIEKL